MGGSGQWSSWEGWIQERRPAEALPAPHPTELLCRGQGDSRSAPPAARGVNTSVSGSRDILRRVDHDVAHPSRISCGSGGKPGTSWSEFVTVTSDLRATLR